MALSIDVKNSILWHTFNFREVCNDEVVLITEIRLTFIFTDLWFRKRNKAYQRDFRENKSRIVL